jgi:HK97 gp10 family phage protein
MLRIAVVGGREALAWARGAVEACHRAVEQGLRKSAALVANRAKRTVYGGHPEHLEGDTGRLRQSITYQVHGARYAEVGTNVRYAKIHEFGGVIEARDRKLVIPVGGAQGSPRGKDLRWAPTADGQGRLVDAGGTTQYLLRDQVTLPARPTFGPALAESQDEVREAMAEALRNAMAAAT